METGSFQSSLEISPFTLLQSQANSSENNKEKETIPISPPPGKICILILFLPFSSPHSCVSLLQERVVTGLNLI